MRTKFLFTGLLAASGVQLTEPTAEALPLAYVKVSTLYLRELPKPGEALPPLNDQSQFVDKGVGAFQTTSDGVIYLEGKRLKTAGFDWTPRSAHAHTAQIDLDVTSFDLEQSSGLLAYIKSGDLYFKQNLSSQPGQKIDDSVTTYRVNQGRIFFTKGSLSFVFELTRDEKGWVRSVVTPLDQLPPTVTLAENQ